MPVVRKQEQVFVHVVMPDAPAHKCAAPHDALAMEFLARPAHVVRATHHKHVVR